MNQPPYQGPPGGPPPGGFGGPPGGGWGAPPGGFGGAPPPGGGGWGDPPGGGFGAPAGGPPGGWGGGPPGYVPPTSIPHTSTLAIVALVSGILANFCCFGVASIVAIVCGFMARSEIQRDPNITGGGMAVAGIVLGFVSFGVGLLLVMLGVLDAILR